MSISPLVKVRVGWVRHRVHRLVSRVPFAITDALTPRHEAAPKVSLKLNAVPVTGHATDHAIPRPGAKRHGVVADAQAAHSVVVPLQSANALPAQNVPDLWSPRY